MKRGSLTLTSLGALAGAIAFAAPAFAGDGTFPPALYGEIGIAPFPQETVIGDFNNDGDQDLAVANASDEVTILRGTAGAEFAPISGFTVPTPAGGGPWDLAIGNFNRDDEEDIAVGNRFTDSVSILLGRPGMGFDAGPGPYPVGDFPIAIETGDFDGDGDDEIATANGNTDNVSILSSAGNGTFTPAVNFAVGDNPRDVQSGDFNNDGDLDLATANLFHQNGSILTGAAGTSFSAASPLPLPVHPAALAVGDFNADNDEDLAFTANQTGVVMIFTGAAGAGFTQAPGSPINDPVESNDIAIGDFNSDADPDLVTTGANTNDLWILHGQPGAGFVSAAGLPITTPDDPMSVAVGDFDGDGNQDLVVPSAEAFARIMRGGGQAPLGGNLLVNGGFETAGAPYDSSSLPPIPNWERTGDISVIRYGAQYSNNFLPDRIAVAALTGGESYLWGGQSGPTGGVTTASQTVALPLTAGEIDGGGSTATLTAMLGGGNVFGDRMSATAAFLAADGTETGSLVLGPVTSSDRANLSTLLPRTGTGAIPAGTRSIRVTMTATDDYANFSSAFADNVKLTVQGGPVPDTPDPDADGDGVPDAADACPALAGSAANGCPDVARKLKLGYDEKKKAFNGKLKPKGPCSAKQKVAIFEAARGKDPRLGKAKTRKSGKFSLAEQADGGDYYAKAKPRTIPEAGNCLAVKSRRRELG